MTTGPDRRYDLHDEILKSEWKDYNATFHNLSSGAIDSLRHELWKNGIDKDTVDKADRLDLLKCILFWVETAEIWRNKSQNKEAIIDQLRNKNHQLQLLIYDEREYLEMLLRALRLISDPIAQKALELPRKGARCPPHFTEAVTDESGWISTGPLLGQCKLCNSQMELGPKYSPSDEGEE